MVEPDTAAFLAGRKVTNANHKIQGGGYSRDLPFIDPALVDGYLTVSSEEAAEGARALARLEGIFAGFSSGANLQRRPDCSGERNMERTSFFSCAIQG